MLGEIAELGLVVAKELTARLRESEDVDETVALAGAFQKISRVVRLTLALDFKLDRGAARDAREAEKAMADARTGGHGLASHLVSSGMSTNPTNGPGPERPAQRAAVQLATENTERARKTAGAFRALSVFSVAKD
jgi:hypothetical protein